MIVRGTVPPAATYAGKDSAELLRFLAKKGAEPSKALTDVRAKLCTWRSNKQSDGERSTILWSFAFMKAARKYDPYYADKTRNSL